MKIYFVVLAKDVSEKYLEAAVVKKNIPYEFVYFRHIILLDGKLFNTKTQEYLRFQKSDRIIIRFPWLEGAKPADYDIFIHYLATYYGDHIPLDRKVFTKHGAFYDDKLFQTFFFEHLNVDYPWTLYAKTQETAREKIEKYPLVAKKRISGRSRGNYVIENSLQFKEFFRIRDIKEYIIQKQVNVKYDLRALVLKSTVIGAVSRRMQIAPDRRLFVKGSTPYVALSQKLKNDCLHIAENFGGDFVGIDVLIDNEGKSYFIEVNISPQFNRFEDVTRIPVSEMIIDSVVN